MYTERTVNDESRQETTPLFAETSEFIIPVTTLRMNECAECTDGEMQETFIVQFTNIEHGLYSNFAFYRPYMLLKFRQAQDT